MNFFFPLFFAAVMAGTSGCGSSPRLANPRTTPAIALSVPVPVSPHNDPDSIPVASAGAEPLPGPSSVEEATASATSPASRPPSQPQEEVLNLFLQGALLDERQKHEDAGKAYSKALELLPGSTYLSAMAGKALLDSGEIDKAIEMVRPAAEQGTQEREVYNLLGEAYAKQRKWEEAIREYERLAGMEPNSVDTWSKLAVLYERIRHFDKAIETYQKMARLDPRQSVYYQYKIATLLSQAHRYEEALEAYQTVARSLPDQFEITLRIGQLQEVLGRTEAAVETFQNALNLTRRPEDEISLRKELGLLFQSRKAYPEAIQQYRRIVEIDPDDRNSRKILAFLLFGQEDQQPALQEAETLLQADPGDFQMQLVRREILKSMNRVQEAHEGFLAGFDSAIGQGQTDEVQYFLVELAQDETIQPLQELDLLESLHLQLEQCRQKFPQNPRILFVSAKIAQTTLDIPRLDQNLRAILSDMEQALASSNQDWISALCGELYSWYKIRLAFGTRGLSGDLLAVLKKCQPVFADNLELLRMVGLVHMDRREWLDAETVFTRARELAIPGDENSKEFSFQLAAVYDKLNRLDDIERILREVIQNYPDDAEAYNFLGYTFADRNIRLEEALTLIEKALLLSPGDGNILDSLGWVYYRLGRNREAIDYLQRALELEKNHPVILDHLGDALQKEGDSEKAVHYWELAIQYGPEYPLEFTPEFLERVKQKIQQAESQEKP